MVILFHMFHYAEEFGKSSCYLVISKKLSKFFLLLFDNLQ